MRGENRLPQKVLLHHASSCSQLELGLSVLSLPGRSIIYEPIHRTRTLRSDSARGQPFFGPIQDSLQHVLLSRTGRHERDLRSMIDHRVREGDAFGRRLGRICDPGDPALFLRQEGVAREQGRGMPVWPHAEHDEVENGEPRRVLLRELLDELLLVVLCDFL